MCQNEHADIEVREKNVNTREGHKRQKMQATIAGISHKEESIAGMV